MSGDARRLGAPLEVPVSKPSGNCTRAPPEKSQPVGPTSLPLFRSSRQQVGDRQWMDQRESNYQDFLKYREQVDKNSVNSILRIRCDIIVGNRPESFRNFQFIVIKRSWITDMGG